MRRENEPPPEFLVLENILETTNAQYLDLQTQSDSKYFSVWLQT
jgi:hypothetical protein